MSLVLDGTGGITTNSGTLLSTSDATINGLTVGKGGGSEAGSTTVGGLSLGGGSTNTGTDNSAFGLGTLYVNTSGSSNSAFGRGAMRYNTTGGSNAAFGYQALNNNTTASNNTAVGYQAGYSNTTGTQLTAVGYQAGYNNTTGSGTTAFGYLALNSNTTGDANSCFGQLAGSDISTGSGNTCVGRATGQFGGGALTTGTYNTLIGYGAIPSSSGGNYQIVISAPNATSTTGKGNSTGFINANGGGVYQGNNSTLWSVTSDQRLKKNIVDNNNGLEIINQIQVRNFEYRLPEEITEISKDQAIEKQGVQLGVIAQELQQILPECVKTESTGVMTVDADNLTWYLINAVKELTARVKQLEGN
jgi:hypothetical protein